MTIRDVLNKILWNGREDSRDYTLTFIHRGANMNRKVIPCNIIKKVKASWFSYTCEGEEVIIPFHRIQEINNIKNGKSVWKKIRD